ncbi:MAG: hypothetical protein JXR20_00380 [Balneola sp.]
MVKVFKTNIDTTENARSVIDQLLQIHPTGRITLDIEDCDNVLRIETKQATDSGIIEAVHSKGFECEVLP